MGESKIHGIAAKNKVNERGLTKMFALILMEYENSLKDIRDDLTMAQAYAIASKGGYYKAQIINEHGVIEYEF